jgi:hypothetical protein
VILDGIDTISTRGDLVNRAIIIRLPRITEIDRRTEKEIMAELDRIRPGVLGAILDILVCGLRKLPEMRLDHLPRLADFCTWVVACEDGLPWASGEFMEVYQDNRRDTNASLVDDDLFATSIVELVEGMNGPFEGTVGTLLQLLEGRSRIDLRFPPRGWPHLARGASNKLKRLSPALRDAGVVVEFLERQKDGRHVRIGSVRSQTDDGEF